MENKPFSLKEFNTFGIDVQANDIRVFSSTEELKDVLVETKEQKQLILGGGSNVLFTKSFDGTVLINRIDGISIVIESETEIIIEAGAGVVWHDFVMHCVNNNWGGLENLSLIPGSVGASPMQNIGAYGVEIKDVFHSLTALRLSDLEEEIFDKNSCEFGYRESVFKRVLKNQYVITKVRFCLQKNPVINASYGAIESELTLLGITNPSIKDISNAVIAIRNSKLPNPKVLGNAGSFFKNPVVDEAVFLKIKENYPTVSAYPQGNGKVKLAAGWLIENVGLKGKRIGNCGVHEKQALVLVNYGGANGNEIYALSSEVVATVFSTFGVELEREVNIL